MPRKRKLSLSRPLPPDDDRNYVRRGIAVDSYSNPPARLGTGTPNLAQAGNYPLVRLTENYPLILSLYRSSWIVRRVIDTIANDMYKSFPGLSTDLKPEMLRLFARAVKKTRTLANLRSGAKWGRLFGGSGAIIILEGHDDLSQPLHLDDIELGAYKGLIPLDRWSGIIPGPIINDNAADPQGFGLPSHYNCIMDSGQTTVHYSRVLRFVGRELPQWEKQVELYWGMSEIEIIFDELQKRDYSSWNIVSLLTRAQILSITEPQLATLMSGAGGTNQAYTNFAERMELMSQYMNNQGLMVLGKDGSLHQTAYGFGGISDVYHEFMKDLAAACEIPYEIIFGRESGLGSNSEGSLQLYDNLIGEKRMSEADPVMDQLIPVICQSSLGFVPDDVDYTWAPFRALSEEQRSNLARGTADTVIGAYNSDLITKREARNELSQASGTNGLFSNITRESIAETPDMFASDIGMLQQEEAQRRQQEVQMEGESARQGLPVPRAGIGIGPGGQGGEPEGAPIQEESNFGEQNPEVRATPDHAIPDHAIAGDSAIRETPDGLLEWISNRINVFRIKK